MSLFARRYGNNKKNCDFYIVDASFYYENGEKVFYMYNPEEWTEHIKSVYGNNWDSSSNIWRINVDDPYDAFYASDIYKIAAYAIVTEEYQFLFSPTEYVGPTFAALSNNEDKNIIHKDVTGGTWGWADFPYFKYVNFNMPYINYSEVTPGKTWNDRLNQINDLCSSLTEDDGYNNTKKIFNYFYNSAAYEQNPNNAWIDTSIDASIVINPGVNVNEIYGGPYVISYLNTPQAPNIWPYTWSIFNQIAFEEDFIDSWQPQDIKGFSALDSSRLTRYGVFPDKGKLHLGDYYIPSKKELKLIIQNIIIAYFDKEWYSNDNALNNEYVIGKTEEIGKLMRAGTSVSKLRPPFLRRDSSVEPYKEQYWLSDNACLWEDIPYGGFDYAFIWSSTPYNWSVWRAYQNPLLTLRLNMYVATPDGTNYTREDINRISSDYIEYKGGTYQDGSPAYWYWLLDTYTEGYKKGRGGFNRPGVRSELNESKLIMCHRIPNNVKWAPESVGHPELKRYN